MPLVTSMYFSGVLINNWEYSFSFLYLEVLEELFSQPKLDIFRGV